MTVMEEVLREGFSDRGSTPLRSTIFYFCFFEEDEMKLSKIVRRVIIMTLLMGLLTPAVSVYATVDIDTAKAEGAAAAEALMVEAQINNFFSQSAFIGNSIGVGLKNYFKSKGPGFMGDPTMLTVGCYSFRNDSAGNSKYMISYNKKSMMAKDAVKATGAKYLFICMGTNDVSEGPEKAFERYVEYLNGIRLTNPGILMFVESCPPSCKGSNVSNEKIDQFNALVYQYSLTTPDVAYIDISTGMKDAEGYLAQELSSDKNCHLSNKAYEIWTNELRSFAYSMILSEMQ